MANNINMLDRMPGFAINALGYVSQPFEDVLGLERDLGYDISKHNGETNFAIMFSTGAWIVIPRATISWGYQDPWFPRNWIGPDDYDIAKTSYHVLYPRQKALPQMDNWYRTHPNFSGLPRVLDVELVHNATGNEIADKTWECCEIIKTRDGYYPWMYSRYMFLNDHFTSWTASEWEKIYLILAQYKWNRSIEHPGPATVPNNVPPEMVLMQQTADKKKGAPGLVESYAIDRLRWEQGNSTERKTLLYNLYNFGDDTGNGDDPPECGCKEEIGQLDTRVKKLESGILVLQTEVAGHVHPEYAPVVHVHAQDQEPVYVEFVVTDEKACAYYQKNGEVNGNGYPIIAEYKYEPVKRWDTDDHLFASRATTRADGVTYWRKLRPGSNGKNDVPSSPVLYVEANRIRQV